MQTNHIPQRPAGLINPVEVPIAQDVLRASQADLIDKKLYPVLYDRLQKAYKQLEEELYAEMFPDTQECLVIEMYPASTAYPA